MHEYAHEYQDLREYEHPIFGTLIVRDESGQ